MQDFRDLENASAFSLEAEVIPADVLAVINPQTSLITVSLGSGPGGDVMYLFQDDICGEKPFATLRAPLTTSPQSLLRWQQNAAPRYQPFASHVRRKVFRGRKKMLKFQKKSWICFLRV